MSHHHDEDMEMTNHIKDRVHLFWTKWEWSVCSCSLLSRSWCTANRAPSTWFRTCLWFVVSDLKFSATYTAVCLGEDVPQRLMHTSTRWERWRDLPFHLFTCRECPVLFCCYHTCITWSEVCSFYPSCATFCSSNKTRILSPLQPNTITPTNTHHLHGTQTVYWSWVESRWCIWLWDGYLSSLIKVVIYHYYHYLYSVKNKSDLRSFTGLIS